MEQRKHPRLSYYDYATPGGYFVTICVKKRRPLFGDVPFRVGRGPCAPPNAARMIAEYWIARISEKYPSWTVDNWVVMPNHMHFIITVAAHGGSSRTPTPTNAKLPAFISTWKRFTNKRAGVSLWQRSYYDHVIRNDAEYLRAWQYIDDNPAHWAEDEYYSD